MRECSKQQHSLDGGDNHMVWKATTSLRLATGPCWWQPLCHQSCWYKRLFGTGFTRWHLSCFLVVHTRPHHQQSLSCHHCLTHQPSLSLYFFISSSIIRILLVRDATAMILPSQISYHWWDPVGLSVPNFRHIQLPCLCLPHTRVSN